MVWLGKEVPCKGGTSISSRSSLEVLLVRSATSRPSAMAAKDILRIRGSVSDREMLNLGIAEAYDKALCSIIKWHKLFTLLTRLLPTLAAGRF